MDKCIHSVFYWYCVTISMSASPVSVVWHWVRQIFIQYNSICAVVLNTLSPTSHWKTFFPLICRQYFNRFVLNINSQSIRRVGSFCVLINEYLSGLPIGNTSLLKVSTYLNPCIRFAMRTFFFFLQMHHWHASVRDTNEKMNIMEINHRLSAYFGLDRNILFFSCLSAAFAYW